MFLKKFSKMKIGEKSTFRRQEIDREILMTDNGRMMG